jgi:hypothetical protein
MKFERAEKFPAPEGMAVDPDRFDPFMFHAMVHKIRKLSMHEQKYILEQLVNLVGQLRAEVGTPSQLN